VCPEREAADVIDFAIEALRKHEKWMDNFARDLEAIVEKMENGKPVERAETTVQGLPVVRCETWKRFKERSRGAESVSVQWTEENGLTISALSNGKVYKYVLEPNGLKSWLSWQLNVPEEKVVEGKIMVRKGARRPKKGASQ